MGTSTQLQMRCCSVSSAAADEKCVPQQEGPWDACSPTGCSGGYERPAPVVLVPGAVPAVAAEVVAAAEAAGESVPAAAAVV